MVVVAVVSADRLVLVEVVINSCVPLSVTVVDTLTALLLVTVELVVVSWVLVCTSTILRLTRVTGALSTS